MSERVRVCVVRETDLQQAEKELKDLRRFKDLTEKLQSPSL